MDFFLNLLIEVAFLSALATLYYFYQKRKLSRYSPEEKLLIDLTELEYLLEHKIQATEHDEDLIEFHKQVLREMENPDIPRTINLLKKMLGKVKDTEVLDFLSDLLKYLNEQISLSEHDNS